MFARAPGVQDIFPDRIDPWNHLNEVAKEVFRLFNYKEIIIPIMELTEVFARGIGDDTDIVSKEMFTFEDRGGRSLTLRPEGTASVVRAYAQNGDYNRLSTCKLFYSGPMFRAERPAKGRFRQFHQFGAEFFGSDDPYYDYEIIAMMNIIARRTGIDRFDLLLNSIGCPDCRKEFIAELKSYFTGTKKKLCKDCVNRLEKNPMRILDCKQESCIALKEKAPRITDYICEDCIAHYGAVKEYCDDRNISYIEDPNLVRGLDYYTRTTFEFVSDDLGGQNAFAAGGRYNNLVAEFGGKPTPAVGFAAGIERMLLLIETAEITFRGLDVYIVHTGGETMETALALCSDLRKSSFSCDIDPSSASFKSQFKRADREGARVAIVIGEDELASQSCTVKDLGTGDQEKVPIDDLIKYLDKTILRP